MKDGDARRLARLLASSAAAVAIGAGLLFACGGGSNPSVGSTSGVNEGDDTDPRYLTDLTLCERKKLCDWTAARGGGYGTSVTCESGAYVANFANQAQCLSSFLGACSSVTVYEWEACRDKTAADPCGNDLFTAPECADVARCIGELDGAPAPPDMTNDGGDGGKDGGCPS